MKNEVYSFEYNYCIYESSYGTISLHKTKKGAYNAMRKFILEGYEQWRDNALRYGKSRFKFGVHEDWLIRTIKLEE